MKVSEEGIFRAVSTRIYNERGQADYIIGKLIDISQEEAEKKVLINKAQIDGLTGLYHASAAKEYIIEALNNKKADTTDVLILIDFDGFKEINDNYGHLIGDEVLQQLTEVLRSTFRSYDIIGRMGGDEFCVYLKDVPSIKIVKEKCIRVNKQLMKIKMEANLSVSLGIALINDITTYEDVYKKADTALYEAKKNGKSQFAIYGGQI